MFGITFPRLVSASLVMAYIREITMLFVTVYVIISLLFLFYPHVMRGPAKNEPGQAFLGILTNLFSPCIIIEEGSKFLVKSSIVATLGHCLTQAMILFIVVTQTMTIEANAGTTLAITYLFFNETSVANDNPPIIHCYPDVDYNITANSTFSRCLVMGDEPTLPCTNGMFHSEGNKKFATICH